MRGGEVILTVVLSKIHLAGPSCRRKLQKWLMINNFFTRRHCFAIIPNLYFHGYPITAVSLFALLLSLLGELHRYMRIEQDVRPQSPSAQLSCNYTLPSVAISQKEEGYPEKRS